MRLKSLEVLNFRAIMLAKLADLPDNVVIAGPNGCGKSCLFDALRLWKSAYGGYSDNEWQQWFGEFQISLERSQPELRTLFRDKSKPIRITAEVVLADEEKVYLRENAVEFLTPLAWQQVSPAGSTVGRNRGTAVAAQVQAHGEEVDKRVTELVEALAAELRQDVFSGTFVIEPNLTLSATASVVLQTVYSLYQPDFVGVFDYHSAQRSYQREQISNVDLRVEVAEQQQGQQALYNAAAKYQNVKTQMAANYIRELIAKEAGVTTTQRASLIESLKELFRLFFPDKEFLGPQPTKNAKLSFNVRTQTGQEHDINELSSGEKEVLYGYLRLRNLSPRNSVLLLDEPELHLNPRLLKGLPQFYHRHLGKALSNQIWLLTHSDVLLGEALDQEGFAVFHMLPATADERINQLVPVARGETLDRAILDLVGEVASFHPKGTLVIFEGGGDTDFDVGMTLDLFPRLVGRINTISGSNKTRVRQLHQLLEAARAKGALELTVFSVVDRDADRPEESTPSRELSWDRYHIENYLLEPRFILEALHDALRDRTTLASEVAVDAALLAAAGEATEAVLRERLERWANSQLVRCIKTGSSPRSIDLVATLHESVDSSRRRLDEVVATVLSSGAIQAKRTETESALALDLAQGTWRQNLPGREILRRFVGRHGGGMEYEVFRNLIISRMRLAGFEPPGMSRVVDTLLASDREQAPTTAAANT